MPARLRPSAPVAADAVLVGDPGRALLLAQELLVEPKMSNHARGLWGYYGRTADGDELSVQATGMGGPSAALVLSDLVELGLRRAIRVGTCTALDPSLPAGELLLVERARAWGGGGGGEAVSPDPDLSGRLRGRLGSATRGVTVASFDVLHAGDAAAAGDVADMQSATLLTRAAELGVSSAAVLIVSEAADGDQGDDEAMAAAATTAGRAAAAALST